MYYQGNLAVERKEELGTAYRETKKIVRRRKPIPVREKLLYLFMVVVCVLVAGLVIWRYAQIYEVNAKLHQMEKEIRMIENENGALELEVNRLSNPERLIERAKQLGLRPSDEGEISEIPSLPRSGTLQASFAYRQ